MPDGTLGGTLDMGRASGVGYRVVRPPPAGLSVGDRLNPAPRSVKRPPPAYSHPHAQPDTPADRCSISSQVVAGDDERRPPPLLRHPGQKLRFEPHPEQV